MCGNLRLSFATQTGTPAPQNQKAHYSIRRNGQDHRDCNIWKFIAFLKIGKEHKRRKIRNLWFFEKHGKEPWHRKFGKLMFFFEEAAKDAGIARPGFLFPLKKLFRDNGIACFRNLYYGRL
jgi:hypothetical protein